MALQRTKLSDIVAVSNSATTVIENTNGTDKWLVTQLTLHNYSASAVTVDIHLPPASGSAPGSTANSNRLHKLTLQPDESREWEPSGGVYLTADGDSIRCTASAASSVNCYVHGDKIT